MCSLAIVVFWGCCCNNLCVPLRIVVCSLIYCKIYQKNIQIAIISNQWWRTGILRFTRGKEWDNGRDYILFIGFKHFKMTEYDACRPSLGSLYSMCSTNERLTAMSLTSRCSLGAFTLTVCCTDKCGRRARRKSLVIFRKKENDSVLLPSSRCIVGAVHTGAEVTMSTSLFLALVSFCWCIIETLVVVMLIALTYLGRCLLKFPMAINYL